MGIEFKWLGLSMQCMHVNKAYCFAPGRNRGAYLCHGKPVLLDVVLEASSRHKVVAQLTRQLVFRASLKVHVCTR